MTTVAGVDSVQGGVETVKAGPSSFNGRKTYSTKRFTHKFQHYIDNATSIPQYNNANFTVTGSQIVSQAMGCGCFIIPYYNLGAATNPGDWAREFANCQRIKVKSLGFKITRMSMVAQQVTVPSGTQTIVNQWEGKPRVMVYIDHDYIMDDFVGVDQNLSAGSMNASSVRWADNSVTSASGYAGGSPEVNCYSTINYISTANGNQAMVVQWPSNVNAGKLEKVSHYIPICQSQNTVNGTAPLNQTDVPQVMTGGANFMSTQNMYDTIDDYIPCQFHNLEDDIRFKWTDPNPVWISTCYLPRPEPTITNLTTGFVAQPAAYQPMIPSWPRNRAQALNTPWKKTYYPMTRTQNVQGVINTTTGDLVTSVNNSLMAPPVGQYDLATEQPPLVYIRVPPVLGTTGLLQQTIMFECEYEMEIECEHFNYPYPIQNADGYDYRGGSYGSGISNSVPNLFGNVPLFGMYNNFDTFGMHAQNGNVPVVW